MTDCLFCKIVAGEIPATVVLEDEKVLAFRDINPAAPTHVLVIPKEHVPDVRDAEAGTVADVIAGAKQVASKEGLTSFRLVFNNGAEAGQSVFHLHVHVLGGRGMSWPPG